MYLKINLILKSFKSLFSCTPIGGRSLKHDINFIMLGWEQFFNIFTSLVTFASFSLLEFGLQFYFICFF